MSSEWSVVLVGGVPVMGRHPLGDWQLARALAVRREILYVDPPLYPSTWVPGRDSGRKTPGLREIAPGLRAVRPIATPGANRHWGVKLGDQVIGRQVRHFSKKMARPRVLLSFDPKRGLLPSVTRDLLVYWRRDRLARSANTAWPELVRARDHALMEAADLVTGVSPPLVEEAAALGAPSELIPNGCDADHFGAPTPPPDGWPSTHPVIGFAGGVSWRLDVDLIRHIADARPDWTLLFVGEGAQQLPDRPNVLRVEAQPYDELPRWVQRFDVGMIPYRCDEFNLAASPLKVYEYLAAGVPVVSTALPAVTPVEGLVANCANAEEFVHAIDVMLAEAPSPQACRALGRANDWSARARRLESLIDARLDDQRAH